MFCLLKQKIRTLSIVAAVLLLFTFIFKPSGEGQPAFAYFAQALDNLRIILDWPKGTFFGIENFVVDWPTVARWPVPQFDFGSIITYVSVIVGAYVLVVLFIYVTGFIGKIWRAYDKSEEVFSKDLDSLRVDPDEIKTLDNISVDGNEVNGEQ